MSDSAFLAGMVAVRYRRWPGDEAPEPVFEYHRVCFRHAVEQVIKHQVVIDLHLATGLGAAICWLCDLDVAAAAEAVRREETAAKERDKGGADGQPPIAPSSLFPEAQGSVAGPVGGGAFPFPPGPFNLS